MDESATSTANAGQPETPRRDQDDIDITQPLLIISSRTPQPGVPAKPSGSWFKKQEQPGVARTPDFIEIGDPAT